MNARLATPCSGVLLEKLRVKKLLAYYGIRRFITVCTTACLLPWTQHDTTSPKPSVEVADPA